MEATEYLKPRVLVQTHSLNPPRRSSIPSSLNAPVIQKHRPQAFKYSPEDESMRGNLILAAPPTFLHDGDLHQAAIAIQDTQGRVLFAAAGGRNRLGGVFPPLSATSRPGWRLPNAQLPLQYRIQRASRRRPIRLRRIDQEGKMALLRYIS